MNGYLTEPIPEASPEAVFVKVHEATRGMNATMSREEVDFALAGLIQMFSLQPEDKVQNKSHNRN